MKPPGWLKLPTGLGYCTNYDVIARYFDDEAQTVKSDMFQSEMQFFEDFMQRLTQEKLQGKLATINHFIYY